MYPTPDLEMVRFANCAIPDAAATGFVPDRVPAPGFAPIASVMLLVAVETRLPPASRTDTWTAGVMAAPAWALEGSTLKPSFVADPTAIVKV